MSVYVDALMHHGGVVRGRPIKTCHLYIEAYDDIEKLHRFAAAIGLKRSWFQHKPGKLPHYDLVKRKRDAAIWRGASEHTREEFVEFVKAWRAVQTKEQS